jgi:hypothetical protein
MMKSAKEISNMSLKSKDLSFHNINNIASKMDPRYKEISRPIEKGRIQNAKMMPK